MNYPLRTQPPLSRPTPMFQVDEPKTDHYADPWDVTEVWLDEVDRDSDAEVHAYFDHNKNGDEYAPSIVGLSIKEGDHTQYITREGVNTFFDVETQIRIERMYGDLLAEGM